MSFFYLSPVKGDMPIYLLETIVFKRIEFLTAINEGGATVFNEYVMEGSVYDNIGHFMLCIGMILNEDKSFKQFFVKAELELFKLRLAALATYDLRSFAKKLLRHIKKYESRPVFFEPLEVLCRHLMLKDIAQHITTSHDSSCFIYNVKINFKHCLPFIAKRQVEISNGIATIPCCKWKQYLLLLFDNNLQRKVNEVNLEALKHDPRITELIAKIKKQNYAFTLTNKAPNILLSKDVDSRSKLFPLCMLNLHRNLRNKHRLSHEQRFHYSLFLKDIGMPVEEAIDFWRAEYRQAPNGSHSCCHNWEKDEKKYLYGIRHMYGLEGAQKCYSSVSCERIQGISNACSEGGCPFKSFDSDKMLKLFDSKCLESQITSQINILKEKRQFASACQFYMRERFPMNPMVNCDNISYNFTPVKYYEIAYEVNKL